MISVRRAGITCSTLLGLLVLSGLAFGQAESASRSDSREGVPLIQLLETFAKKSNKTFIVDPRVQANVVMLGVDPEKITYSQLLAALQIHGFAAVEIGGITRVVPDANARALATPILSGNEKHDPSEVVTHVVKVKSRPAAQLVPILRSMMPQWGHLAADQCSNEILMVDAYANVKRMESVIAALDKGAPLALEPCSMRAPAVVPLQPAKPAEDR
jgi:general secretion pathway protein D